MKTSRPSWGIHWFRRDLRLADNPALHAHLLGKPGRVLGLFCVDPGITSREDFSPDRFHFFLKSLQVLQADYRQAGGDLLVLEGSPSEVIKRLLPLQPTSVSFNRDYEPYARKRDEAIQLLLGDHGIECLTYRDHVLIEPDENTKDDGTLYQVYSAYARQWYKKFAGSEIQRRLEPLAKPRFKLCWKDLDPKLEDRLESQLEKNIKRVRVPIPEVGEMAAWKRVKHFQGTISAYATDRDIPSIEGTSKFSIFLKTGTLTTAQLIRELELSRCKFEQKTGEAVFLKELVWREFYYSILFHAPRVLNEAFNPKYGDIDWENDDELFTAWKNGKTGYPIVDAGMRQLRETGWMHNRVRMIVASFLTKDLLIDWKWGERFFMQHLLDGDQAANNGGWQWCASTGNDPQPYFRIFNPALQSKRYDPEGEYIRRFVPELRSLSSRQIHEPTPAEALAAGYPLPVVVHSSRKIKALSLFRSQR